MTMVEEDMLAFFSSMKAVLWVDDKPENNTAMMRECGLGCTWGGLVPHHH